MICSSFTDRIYPKNAKKHIKKVIKWSKIKILKNYWNLSRYRPKDNIFKTLCSYAKNYVLEVKNLIKSSKIVKYGPQIVKNAYTLHTPKLIAVTLFFLSFSFFFLPLKRIPTCRCLLAREWRHRISIFGLGHFFGREPRFSDFSVCSKIKSRIIFKFEI